MIGKNIYNQLKKNNTAVWAMAFVTIISVISSISFVFLTYQNARNTTYAISTKGELVPLKLLDNKKDRIKQVQANLDYFTSCFYDLDTYNLKEKQEKLQWLINPKVTAIVKDKEKKGYYNRFLQFGITQHAKIVPTSFKVYSNDNPYKIDFQVEIQVINGEVQDFYLSDVTCVLENVNINYPYNPYGLLITDFIENKLTKVEKE